MLGKMINPLVAVSVSIILTYLLWGDSLERWSSSFLLPGNSRFAIASGVVLLQSLDVVLPLPSSLIATSAGALLGVATGWLCSFIGMSLSCAIGYLLGRLWPTKPEDSALTAYQQTALAGLHGRLIYTIALARGIPVLAEATVVSAGHLKMRPRVFFGVSTSANALVSLAYAVAGTSTHGVMAFAVAFALCAALPFLLMRSRALLSNAAASESLTNDSALAR